MNDVMHQFVVGNFVFGRIVTDIMGSLGPYSSPNHHN